MYCPIESDDLPPAAVRDLATVDLLVAYSDFGRQVLERAFTALEQQCPGTHRPPITVIPHGLDPAVFYPLAEPRMSAGMQQSKRTARAQLFPNRPELQDAVIILNANRNVFRKRVDLTLDAFAHFLADKPDNIYLYLHMGMQDRGVDVLARAATRGLAHRLLTTTHDAPHPQVANAQLNLIYNACDIGVNTATSEGWGLVAFEHAATAAAQILPDHSACTALWQDVGLLIPTMATNGVISVEALATALQHCWHNPAFRHAAALRAYRFATRPQFQWSVIATTWKDLLLEVVCRAHWPPTGRAPPTTSASQAE